MNFIEIILVDILGKFADMRMIKKVKNLFELSYRIVIVVLLRQVLLKPQPGGHAAFEIWTSMGLL